VNQTLRHFDRALDRSLRVIVAGHVFMENVGRGHYELAVEEPANRRVAVAVEELALVI